MRVSEAMENYLETIYILSRKQPDVHAADICAYLEYSRPTVSVVVRQLRDQGYLEINDANHITLTAQGREVAERMYERHNLLAEMLISIGVDERTAYRDACKMEHDLSKESFDRIREFYRRQMK
ncbi:MAG: metal-dependent transcriptional regulator [Christensenellales bacterium]